MRKTLKALILCSILICIGLLSAPEVLADDSRAGREIDTVGGTDTLTFTSGAAAGNCFRMDTDVVLEEVEFWVHPFAVQTLTFYVFESTVEFGSYDEIHRNSITSGSGAAEWYSSGPVSVQLMAGKYYIIAFSFDGMLGFFGNLGDSESTSFGAQVHGFSESTDPLPATITSLDDNQIIYYQRLTTSGGGHPHLDIKCNGQDSNVIVNVGTHAVVTIDLIANDLAGIDHDVWVLAMTPTGGKWAYGSIPTPMWRRGWCHEYYTGPLMDLSDTVLDSLVPIGSYKAWIGIDYNANGNLNIPALVDYDMVDFEVVP